MLDVPTGSRSQDDDHVVDAVKTLVWLHKQESQRKLSSLEQLAKGTLLADLKIPKNVLEVPDLAAASQYESTGQLSKTNVTPEDSLIDSSKIITGSSRSMKNLIIETCKTACHLLSISTVYCLNKIRQAVSHLPKITFSIKYFSNPAMLHAINATAALSVAAYCFYKGQSVIPGFLLITAWRSLGKSNLLNSAAGVFQSSRSSFINFSDISRQETKHFSVGRIISKDPDAHKLLYVTNISLPLSNDGKVAPAFNFDANKLKDMSNLAYYTLQRANFEQHSVAWQKISLHPGGEPTGKEIDITFDIKTAISCLPVPVGYRVTHAEQYLTGTSSVVLPPIKHSAIGGAELEIPIAGKIQYRIVPSTETVSDRIVGFHRHPAVSFFRNSAGNHAEAAELQKKILNEINGEPNDLLTVLNLRSAFWDDNTRIGSQMKFVARQSQLFEYLLTTRTGVCDALAWFYAKFLNNHNVSAYHTVGLVSSAYDGKGDGNSFSGTPHAAVSYYDPKEARFFPFDPSAIAGHGSDLAPLNTAFSSGFFGRIKLLKQLKAGIAHSKLFGMPERLVHDSSEESFPELQPKVLERLQKNALLLLNENPQLFGKIVEHCTVLLASLELDPIERSLLDELISIIEKQPTPESVLPLQQWLREKIPVFRYKPNEGPSVPSIKNREVFRSYTKAMFTVLAHGELPITEISDIVCFLLFELDDGSASTQYRSSIAHFTATSRAFASALKKTSGMVAADSEKFIAILISKNPLWRDTYAEQELLSVFKAIESHVGQEVLLRQLAPFGKLLPACLRDYFSSLDESLVRRSFFTAPKSLVLTTLVGLRFLTGKDVSHNISVERIKRKALTASQKTDKDCRELLRFFVNDDFVGPRHHLALEQQERILASGPVGIKNQRITPRSSIESEQQTIERSIALLENHGSEKQVILATLLKERLCHTATFESVRQCNPIAPRRVIKKESLMPMFVDILNEYSAAGHGEQMIRQLAYGQSGRQDNLIAALANELMGMQSAESFSLFLKTPHKSVGTPVNTFIRNILSLATPDTPSVIAGLDLRLAINPHERLFEYEYSFNTSLPFNPDRKTLAEANGYDTKQYSPGDSLRHVDWKYFARNGQLVLRKEQNISIDNRVCILDARAAEDYETFCQMLSAIHSYAMIRKIRIGLSIQWDTTEIAAVSDVRLLRRTASFMDACDGLIESVTAAIACESNLGTMVTGPASLLLKSPLRRRNSQVIVVSDNDTTANRLVNAAASRGNIVQEAMSSEQLLRILNPAKPLEISTR